ncbi:MAG: M3 family oligoendopeptidase [Phycisphaerae bacterium]
MIQSLAQPEFPRQFVEPDARFESWPAIEPYFAELAKRPVASLADFERWLFDWSELEAAFAEENTRRYTAMTCRTDDDATRDRFLDYVENVKPLREPWAHKLNQRFVALADKFPLPEKRYEVLERSIRAEIELFREENIPLETIDEKLATDYQQITGVMSVTFRDQEHTIQQMSLYLEDNDRMTREAAWRATAQRYLDDAPKLDALYAEMVNVRGQIAANADVANFRDYRFRAMERFDYTPGDCLAFHNAIERVVLPAAREINARRRKALDVASLRPWDLDVDPAGRPALRPFATVAELEDGCERIFADVDADFAKIFATMRGQNMLDLDSRKGKAPGGYQATFDERRMPYIFMNAVGTDDDVRTLLHEGGHAFHTWACRQDPLLPYRNYPTEFAEVASMGMECLAAGLMEDYYGHETPRAQRQFFEKIVLFFPYMACVDAFQHFVYTNAEAGLDAWKDHWESLMQRFSTGVDQAGLEEFRRHSWHRKLHIFELPFYYVEYGIAQIGALQVWLNAKRDYREAVAFYRQGLSLGGSRPLPELFEAAGCKFDFTEATLKPLIDAVMEEIDGLKYSR